MADKRIKIVCKTGFNLKVGEIHALQGDLKELTEVNEMKLLEEIEKTGFAFAPHVWFDRGKKKYYLIDGHQRLSVVRKMISHGWKCDTLPVVVVQASNIDEAKRRVLQSISQYGTVTNQGLFDFTNTMKIDPDSIVKAFKIPDINLTKWKQHYFKPTALDSVEADQDTTTGSVSSSTLVHTCPKCGEKFSAEK